MICKHLYVSKVVYILEASMCWLTFVFILVYPKAKYMNACRHKWDHVNSSANQLAFLDLLQNADNFVCSQSIQK